MRTVLPALTYTTAIVGIGFGLLALSDFTFIRNLGVLMAVVMTVCLCADVHLLPTLLAEVEDEDSGSTGLGARR